MDVDALKNEFHLVCLVRSLRETHRLTGSRWVSAKADSSQGFGLPVGRADATALARSVVVNLLASQRVPTVDATTGASMSMLL
jgi:hypothetical protein